MTFLTRLLGRRSTAMAAVPGPIARSPPAPQRDWDPWFRSHYQGAAAIVLDLVPADCLAKGRIAVDFGCGDGATTLGVASRVQAEVIGLDLYLTFLHLPDLAQRNLGVRELPPNLAFRQNRLGEPLPLAEASVDLVYSWSVFEHVADVPGVLAELARITKPGGLLLIQVEPLFYGPYGSHLQRLVDEPWAHLRLGEDEFLRRAAAARDEVPEHEKDTLYRDHSFEELKRYLLGEYRSLNRITADELIRSVSAAGFDIADTRLIEPEGVEPDASLLQQYPRELLLTNQIVLTARRSRTRC
jgi:ubiquinone/menaquinone biosynthesis C-methylase UbiE